MIEEKLHGVMEEEMRREPGPSAEEELSGRLEDKRGFQKRR